MLADTIVVELLPQDWNAAIACQSPSSSRCLVAQAIKRVTGFDNSVLYYFADIYSTERSRYSLSENAHEIITYFDCANTKNMAGKPVPEMKLGTITLTRKF